MKRIKVHWTGALVIDGEFEVQINEYSFVKINGGRVEQMFKVNRTTLDYSWGKFLESLGSFWSSEGICQKLDRKI